MDIKEILKRVRYDQYTGEFFHHGDAQKHLHGKRCGTVCNYNSGIQYHLIKVNRVQYLAHRVAYCIVHGSIPEGLEIDHINRVGTDNRISNLRAVTRSENARNKRKLIKKTSGSFGVAGVNFENYREKYKAIITVDGKQKTLGRYDDFFNAVCARKSAENAYGYNK